MAEILWYLSLTVYQAVLSCLMMGCLNLSKDTGNYVCELSVKFFASYYLTLKVRIKMKHLPDFLYIV
ncbi:hypothetical protein SFSGTM_11140 [Sulfuriferula nivalis]|uniref:Uncharacterized protein n=1 Tax=Sulfuriferula nivalis TaxID=2675298 RepID=A0A809RFI8_9PROT|nr:hypothetical protein SFSGTM_11140 [Sulfuriferula nivalis]